MTSVFTRPLRVLAIGVGVLAVCVGMLAGYAFSAAHAATEPASTATVRAQQPADPTTDAKSDSTLPPGPRIEPEESEQATQDRAQTKVILAAVAIGLLVIVVFGNKKRDKHKKPGRK